MEEIEVDLMFLLINLILSVNFGIQDLLLCADLLQLCLEISKMEAIFASCHASRAIC